MKNNKLASATLAGLMGLGLVLGNTSVSFADKGKDCDCTKCEDEKCKGDCANGECSHHKKKEHKHGKEKKNEKPAEKPAS
ncbi:MAG: hypothetical protein JNL01_08575 [Bdellovibrionales bacterium]|nr:hypothetical protein [Bdellovibrionales bacterium]